jgi:hypothetical protein
MRVTLDDTDRERMPAPLKRDFIRYLAMLLARPGGMAGSARHTPLADLGRLQSESMVLVVDRPPTLDLIREVSFDERGEIFHIGIAGMLMHRSSMPMLRSAVRVGWPRRC